jgi:ribonuclease P protein component
MGKFSFGKEERLSSEKDIQELFQKGSSFYLYPFKVLFIAPSSPKKRPAVLISVSKRNFKHAVSRNQLKRRIREAYRLNKSILPAASALHIGFIYTPKEILSAKEISEKMVHVLKKISRGSSVS